jgi:hypothetical protein
LIFHFHFKHEIKCSSAWVHPATQMLGEPCADHNGKCWPASREWDPVRADWWRWKEPILFEKWKLKGTVSVNWKSCGLIGALRGYRYTESRIYSSLSLSHFVELLK